MRDKYNYKRKRKFVKKENKLDKKHYAFFVMLSILWIIYFLRYKLETIGGDYRNAIFALFGPIIIGLLFFSFYRKEVILIKYSTAKGMLMKIITIIFLLFQGILGSLISVGLVANITLDYLNKSLSAESLIETTDCTIIKFHQGGRRDNSYVWFNYFGKHERIDMTDRKIRQYSDKKPDDYRIEVKARKGIWGTYIIESWRIKNIR